MRFMHKEMELWTSFTSPRWLNIELLSCASDKLDDLPSILILVKTEGSGLFPLSLT